MEGRIRNGISYLYLSDSEKTTLYEIRASLYDYVSVARFRLNEDIQVVNLSFLSIDIFAYADEDMLEDILIYKDFILKLEDELSNHIEDTILIWTISYAICFRVYKVYGV